MTKGCRYAIVGALAGLGVPLGAAILQRFALGGTGFGDWVPAHFFYAYMAAQAVGSLSLAGYWLGRQRDTLEAERCTCQSTRSALNRLVVTDALTGLYN